MIDFEQMKQKFVSQMKDVKLLRNDKNNWLKCLSSVSHRQYVPLQYKPDFLEYQEAYFKDVYSSYSDISLVLYRGGVIAGIWSVCMYLDKEKLCFGTAGTALMGPLFTHLSKAEVQRSVIESCLKAVFSVLSETQNHQVVCCETILDEGGSQWIRKIMEHGGITRKVTWQAFADLSLSIEDIMSRIRRTNKYSVSKGKETYKIEIYESGTKLLHEMFQEFHFMHRGIAKRETRSQLTWEIQERIVKESSNTNGHSFLIFIRDKVSDALAGAALFDSTPQTGLYCVAAYDRERFSKPVGHIVQAVAMEKMKEYGIRWYEIGERAYSSDLETNEKVVNIGHYKEGFATHLFPRIFAEIAFEDFLKNQLH